MRQSKLRPQDSPLAFTLIELLIVVAIIAILAAIAVPNFLEAQMRAKISRAQADMRTLHTGLAATEPTTAACPSTETMWTPSTPTCGTPASAWRPDDPGGLSLDDPPGAGPFENELNPPESMHRIAYEWATTRNLAAGNVLVGGGGAGYMPSPHPNTGSPGEAPTRDSTSPISAVPQTPQRRATASPSPKSPRRARAITTPPTAPARPATSSYGAPETPDSVSGKEKKQG